MGESNSKSLSQEERERLRALARYHEEIDRRTQEMLDWLKAHPRKRTNRKFFDLETVMENVEWEECIRLCK